MARTPFLLQRALALFLLAGALVLAWTRPAALATESCAVHELAQNASVVLSWTLHDGAETFTRVSHTMEALTSSGSSPSPGRLLLIGGIEYESAQPVVTNPLLVYDVATNAFLKPQDAVLSSPMLSTLQQTSSAKRVVDDKFTSPASRVDHASFARTNVVYVFGGQNKEFLNDTWRLCLDDGATTASWDQLVAPTDAVTRSATPAPRIGHSFTHVFENATTIGAVVYGGISEAYAELDGLHLALITKAPAGGSGCANRSPRIVWRMLRTNTTSPGLGGPVPRAYHAAVTTSTLFASTATSVCLLVYGGKNTQLGLIFDELWRLCPLPTSASSAAPIESLVYVWELLAPLGTTPGARYGASAVFIDEGKVALAGGSYTFPNDYLRDTWELNVNATQWVRLRFESDFTPPRRGHALAYVPATARLWLMGGKDRYAVVTKRIESTQYAAPFCAIGYRIALCDVTGEYVCIPCPAGQYLERGTRNCRPCAQGTFSAAGAAECTLCPAGTYSTVVGKTSDSPCTACPLGTASSTLGASTLAACLACTAGTFASSTGSTACTACAAGAHSNASASVCTLCRPGQWSAAGAPTCQHCSAGTFAPISGSAACFACPRGLYSDSGADACLPCPRSTSSSGIGASSAACQPCPAFAFTTALGQTQCQVCSPGSSLVNGTCQACARGSYASERTGGACLPCPIGSFASSAGSSQCEACPAGSTTSAPGAQALTDCVLCATGSSLTGASSCSACPPGSFAPSAGVCTTCAAGNYSVDLAQRECTQCPAMTSASERGSTRCTACPDGAFALTGWSHCLACGLSNEQLSGCKVGRNGVLCSGSGRCLYGGCACSDGWASADCSVATSSTAASPASAVLYFPQSQTQLVAFPITQSSASDVAITIARSGPLGTALTAYAHWSASNFSTAPSGFPLPVTFGTGVQTQTIKVSLAALTPRTGCRSFTLTLRDVAGSATPSAVSVDADRSITVYVDDMNGAASSGAGASLRTLAATYALPSSDSTSSNSSTGALATATVALDRVLATDLTLSPASTASTSSVLLQNQRLSVLVAIDRASAAAVVPWLPAIIAQLQTHYQVDSDAIRLGLVLGATNNSNSTAAAAPPSTAFYTSTSAFVSAVQQLVADSASAALQQQETLSWSWLAAALARNASAWPAPGRRFLWVFDSYQLSLPATTASASTAATAFEATALAQSVFSLFLQPSPLAPTNAMDVTGREHLMQLVRYDSVALLPATLLRVHQARDASLPSRASVLDDQMRVVTSAHVQAFAAGAGSMPVLRMLFTALPTAASAVALGVATTVTLSVPGLLQLTVRIVAPSHACFPPAVAPPADPEVFSGWIESWTSSTLAETQQRWTSASSSLALSLYNDTSLLQTATTAVLSMRDALRTRMTLTRTLTGADISAGLALVVRGYMRISASDASVGTATCDQRVALVSANGSSLDAAVSHTSAVSRGEWHYGWLKRIVPWDVDRATVTLDCTTSAPGVSIEWTSLGLAPDPSFACKCPRGLFNDVLTAGDGGACVRCPAGSYCAAGIKRRCPNGTFSFGKASACERCRDGWLCVDGLARLCLPGTFASPQSFTCDVCPAGSACRNGKRTSCPPGMFSRTQASDCESCPPGTIARLEASTTCERCPLGQTSNYQRDHCVACAAGEKTAHTAQHTCASCLATVFPSRSALEQCVP